MLFYLAALLPASADFPSTINYQGRLVSGAELVNAVVDMRFRLFTEPAGGDLLFESTNEVLVVDGLYATEIGEHPVFGTLQEALKNYPVYVEVEVDEDVLSPRERFTAVPYALRAAPPSQGQNVSIIDSSGEETFYPSVTNAFQHLAPGQTLRLYPGDHYLNVAPAHAGSPVGKAGLLMDGLSNVRLEGIGNARLYSDQYGDYLFIQNSYNIDIEGITFDGLGPNAGTIQNFAMINFRGTNRNIRIANCRFLNFGRHGISHLHYDKQTQHVLIEQCFFKNGGDATSPTLNDDGAAISGIGAYWTIVNNQIINVLRGIEVEGPGPTPQSNIVIANNQLKDIWSMGIMLFPSAGAYTDILIQGNTLSGLHPRPPEVTYMGGGIVIQGGERIIIRGNTVRNFPYSLYGIALMTARDIRDSVISDNFVSDMPQHGIRLWEMNNYELVNCVISGNHVLRSGTVGFWVSGKRHVLQNNTVRDSGTSSADGIHVFGGTNSMDIVLGQNVIHGKGTGIRIDSGVTHTRVKNNVLYDNDADVVDNGTDTEF